MGKSVEMLSYLLNRLITAAGLALFATLVVFLIASLVPGDPILAVLGDLAASKPEIVAEYRARWGLDLPLWQQYWIFLGRLFQGDLGISISTGRPVLTDIAQYAPATVELGTIAFGLSLLIGIPLGIMAAIWRDSWVDHAARFISLVGVSSPVFWLAFIALTVFYGWLQIAPGPGRLDPIDFPPAIITGFFLIDSLLAGQWDTFKTALAHLVLPSLVLCAATLGLITRMTRASMLETLGQDYVRVAHAKGMKHRAVIISHALPNALIPVITLAGLAYANLLTGTIMTETIFSWPGLGRYTFRSALSLDLPAIMGMTLIFAIVYLIINLLVDLSYAIVDPRVLKR
jgi:peptide/nickel transport system permease protein